MIDIMFRVWDKKEKKMKSVTFLDFVELEIITGGDPNSCIIRGFDYLMQFTGFKDKNGKAIYECDMDKHGNIVKFVDGCYRLNGDRPLAEMLSSFEIAGNIYQNPELLNATD